MRRTIITVLILTAFAAVCAEGDDMSPIGMALKVGTPGATAEGTLRLIDTLNLRIGANYLTYDYSGEAEDVEYDFRLRFFSVPLYLDWHPFGGNWRISIAGVYNDSRVELEGRPSENVEFNDHEYTAEEVGSLTGEIEFQQLAPYFGIGFGNTVLKDQRWIFVFDIGIVYLSYNVNLSADGTLANNPQFQQDLQAEEDKLQDDVDEWKIYPVISFGVGFHF